VPNHSVAIGKLEYLSVALKLTRTKQEFLWKTTDSEESRGRQHAYSEHKLQSQLQVPRMNNPESTTKNDECGVEDSSRVD
jgi:hypothetical protein